MCREMSSKRDVEAIAEERFKTELRKREKEVFAEIYRINLEWMREKDAQIREGRSFGRGKQIEP